MDAVIYIVAIWVIAWLTLMAIGFPILTFYLFRELFDFVKYPSLRWYYSTFHPNRVVKIKYLIERKLGAEVKASNGVMFRYLGKDKHLILKQNGKTNTSTTLKKKGK
jgi:hypothetical protein